MSEEKNEKDLELANAFVGGVKAASLALNQVLIRKVRLGIIEEVTARVIFEDTGLAVTEAIDAALAK